jgi:hypothetical protein
MTNKMLLKNSIKFRIFFSPNAVPFVDLADGTLRIKI